MIAAIHQPQYFPWVGYFDKMAKAEAFVLLDQVQLEKGSQMIRNRVLDTNGEVKYITISGDTKNFLQREYRDLKTKDLHIWKSRQLNSLENYYRKAEYRDEILQMMQTFFLAEYSTICEWTCASIALIKEMLEIETKLIFQSDIDYDRSSKRSELVFSLCNAINADMYLSGKGASVDYLDRDRFKECGIEIVFQTFEHPIYTQCNSMEFKAGLSILDMLFNCGIDVTKNVFWDNVKKNNLCN